jgi:hypothetical protein
MARMFFVILVIAVLFMANTALAGERETPHTGEVKIVYNDDFLPPHIIAEQELTEIQEEWLAQELTAFLSKQEGEND